MKIQWYPGHMTKAKRKMQEDIKKVDLIVEILDARIPLSSRNPDIDTLAQNKYRLVVLNKQDLADPQKTALWTAFFKERGIVAVTVDGRSKGLKKTLEKAISQVCAERIEKLRSKGYLNPEIKAMIAGIPNVGKSTIINTLAGKASLKTGNKPGVTKTNQWLRVSPSLSLLDTPGILWPKFDDEQVGMNLAFIGSVSDEIVNTEELCYELVKFLMKESPNALLNRYAVAFSEETDPNELIEAVATKRGALRKGGEIDRMKVSSLIIDDFRSVKLGLITLEVPNHG